MSGDGRGSGPDGQAEDEDEESSSSSSSRDLEDFRKKWKNEIRGRHEEPESADVEAQAMRLFMEGVTHEEKGEMYEAILKYRKAVHLIPDIEKKSFEVSATKGKRPPLVIEVAEDAAAYDRQMALDEIEEDLVGHFAKMTLVAKTICQPAIVTNMTHISCLPMEVLVNIMKWVVSDELDLKSLESASEVCRGFYLVARSSDVWRLICLRTWAIEAVQVAGLKTNDWRRLFLSKPRVHHQGCYLAKMSYMREGERGFTDHQFYRAWHVVQYYRVLRFFPGGKVVMNTTAEEPAQAVKMFQYSNGCGNPGCMIGRYQTFNDRVVCVVKKVSTMNNNVRRMTYKGNNKRNIRSQYHFEVPHQVFHFELEIKGKRHKQLHWVNYSVVSRYKSSGREQSTDMDVSNVNNYPPLQFSMVRSFRSDTTQAPLG